MVGMSKVNECGLSHIAPDNRGVEEMRAKKYIVAKNRLGKDT
jgi:hypothetical protein